MAYENLLPGNSSELEQALTEAGSPISDIAVPIHLVRDPANIPDHMLGVLALELSVDVWHEDWPIERKRWVVANSIRLHRMKGTLAGMREHVALAGGEVVGARLPPDGSYPGGQTPEEKAAWLARFPQVRTYRKRAVAEGMGGMVAGACYPGDEDVSSCPLEDLAADYAFKQTYLYDPATGEETALKRIERQAVDANGVSRDVETVLLPLNLGAGLVMGDGAAGDAVALGETARDRMLHRYVDGAYTALGEVVSRTTISTGLDRPIDTVSEQVVEIRPMPTGAMIAGLTAFGEGENHLTHPDIELARYARLYLFDPARVAAEVITGGDFMTCGYSRLGRPPYTTEIVVRMVAPAGGLMFPGLAAAGDGAASNAPDYSKEIRDAVVTAKAARDHVLIRTQTHRPIAVRDAPKVGEVFVGQSQPYTF
ncbi:phage tail protein [Stappia sp. 22II-S9-Z10]|nr:phage tail protein [Stappia sp. 22II-S9-Z10]